MGACVHGVNRVVLANKAQTHRQLNNRTARDKNGLAIDKRKHYCASFADVVRARDTGDVQIIDARPEARFSGRQAEPRQGLACGHIPNSLNVPYRSLSADDGSFLRDKALRQQFEKHGVAVDAPTLCSCGSGITACVLAFGLFCLGNESVWVYDGSWAEWGRKRKDDIETAPA